MRSAWSRHILKLTLCLLGRRAVKLKTRQERKTVGLAFLAAKRVILSNWKIHKLSFSIETWIFELFNLLGMERITDTFNDIKFRSETIRKQVWG